MVSHAVTTQKIDGETVISNLAGTWYLASEKKIKNILKIKDCIFVAPKIVFDFYIFLFFVARTNSLFQIAPVLET